MRIFASDVRALLASGAGASALARALLGYAVKQVWGMDCPEIEKDESGKPYFAGAPGKFFSISHSKSHVLVGLSEHELGVDAETVRDIRPGLSERLFSEEMLASFGFFQAWTLRESVFKLTGRGSLWEMEFSLENGEIRAPFEGVRCRLYSDLEGCAAAAACREGDFPEHMEIVPAGLFWP